MIFFTKHARDKFEILKRHKCIVTEQQVLVTVNNPEIIDYSHSPLIIAQYGIDKNHVLRVVYKKQGQIIKIITFYPGRRKQYEKNF